MGIEWAPLNIPLYRRLQTLCSTARIWFLFGEPLGVYLMYKLIYSSYWWVGIAYLLWMLYDIESCNRGNRKREWFRNLAVWRYHCEYFPIKLVKTVDLDPSKNYLCCVFPHGYVSYGVFGAFATNGANVKEILPGMTTHMITLRPRFLIPFLREVFLTLGMCSSSFESLMYLLDPRKHKGKCACLVVGGTSEVMMLHPGQYNIRLSDRKGFIKVAMFSGAPLVPVLAFGEPNLFRPFNYPEGSFIRKIQMLYTKLTGLALVIPTARGLFQYTWGIVPFREPITVVVGAPIHVDKNLNPTKEEVDNLHATFKNKLIELFETEKVKYIKDHENVHLNIL